MLSIVRWIGVWISASRREDLAVREFLGSNASRISLAENSSARILRCKIVWGDMAGGQPQCGGAVRGLHSALLLGGGHIPHALRSKAEVISVFAVAPGLPGRTGGAASSRSSVEK